MSGQVVGVSADPRDEKYIWVFYRYFDLRECGIVSLEERRGCSLTVFLLCRPGRHWLGWINSRFMAVTNTSISFPSILKVDALTGEVLSAVGSGLFYMPHGLKVLFVTIFSHMFVTLSHAYAD